MTHDSALRELLQQIEQECNCSLSSAGGATEGADIPEALLPLYKILNGASLPLGELYPASDFHSEGFPPEWICFGADHYFSFFLCHRSASPALTTWDHDSGTEIEGVYASAYEWLSDMYREFLEADRATCAVVVKSIPADAPKAKLLGPLKPLGEKSSSEWLEEIRAGSFRLPKLKRVDAIAAVRQLRPLGVDCHVDFVELDD